MHLRDSFVNFRCDDDNIFTHFYITMGYSDMSIDFDDGEGQGRKGTSLLTFWGSAGQAPKRWDLNLHEHGRHFGLVAKQGSED